MASGVGHRGTARLEGRLLKLGERPEERTLLVGREGGAHDVTFPGVQGWEQLIDDGLGIGRDVDEELASVVGVWLAADEIPLLEVVEQ